MSPACAATLPCGVYTNRPFGYQRRCMKRLDRLHGVPVDLLFHDAVFRL